MSVLLILLITSLVIASAFLAAFIWSVRSGQYEDDYTPSVRMLFEDRQPSPETEDQQTPTETNKVNGSHETGTKRPA